MDLLKFLRPSRRALPIALDAYSLPSAAWGTDKNPTAETCIRKISLTLASLNLTLYTHRKGGGRSQAYPHPLFLALRNPNPNYTPVLWYSSMIDSILRYGGAFIVKSTVAGQIFFTLLDPRMVTIKIDNGARTYIYNGQVYTDKTLLYIPNLILDKGVGISHLTRYRELIELDNQLEAYIREFFRNSTGKRTVIEFDKDKWGEKDMARAYSLIMPAVQKFILGAENSGKPLIPPPGTKLGVHDMSQNLYEDLRSLKELIERQIAQSFGVPYSLISETNKYASLELNQLQLLQDAIMPLGTHIEQSFNRLLAPDESALYCKYDYGAMLRSDIKTTVDYLAKEVSSGLMTINEARDMLELPGVDAGDTTFVPANLYPLTQANVDAFFAQSKLALHNSAGDNKA